jgi:uncharacterized protein (DUF983 family)
MGPDLEIVKTALSCRCPRCRQGALYPDGFNLTLKSSCEKCGLDFSKNDSADGPAVFLIFILGALLVPMAWILEAFISPPLWVHAVLWTGVALVLTVGALRPLKAYIKHRPGDWE